MRFLIDECTGRRVANWLIEQGHDVLVVSDISKGANDNNVLELAYQEKRVLVTMDSDFGRLIFRDDNPHHGIIFLRLNDESVEVRKRVLDEVILMFGEQLIGYFLVVSEQKIRVAQRRYKPE